MSTSRLETFSDGVFAIAATLLILDVHADGPRLGHALVRAWPSYAAYGVSFVTIGIMWVNHHTVLEQIGRANRTFLFVNVFFLMLVAFVPFPTRLVAEHFRDGGARAADLSYGITMTSTAVFYNALWLYAAQGGRLLREDADASVVSGLTRSYRVGPLMYLAATLVALASPRISVALFTIIALSYVVESSVFAPRET